MDILDDLLSSQDTNIAVKQVQVGVFWTAVVSKNCGLSSTFINKDNPHAHKQKVEMAGQLIQKNALELASYIKSDYQLEASIGMAALNSLLDVNESDCIELNAANYLCSKVKGKKCAIIGHFPFVDKLKELADNLWVIEQRPREGDHPEQEMANILPQCDVIGITGTSLINHTFANILKCCPDKSHKVMIGSSTPLSPVLFDYGMDVLFGSKVVEPESVMRYVSQGATFREIHKHGVKLLAMSKE